MFRTDLFGEGPAGAVQDTQLGASDRSLRVAPRVFSCILLFDVRTRPAGCIPANGPGAATVGDDGQAARRLEAVWRPNGFGSHWVPAATTKMPKAHRMQRRGGCQRAARCQAQAGSVAGGDEVIDRPYIRGTEDNRSLLGSRGAACPPGSGDIYPLQRHPHVEHGAKEMLDFTGTPGGDQSQCVDRMPLSSCSSGQRRCSFGSLDPACTPSPSSEHRN